MSAKIETHICLIKSLLDTFLTKYFDVCRLVLYFALLPMQKSLVKKTRLGEANTFFVILCICVFYILYY